MFRRAFLIVIALLALGGDDRTAAQSPPPRLDTAILAQTGLQNLYDAGLTGAGQRVGVLDRGFGGLLTFESAFNVTVTLPAGVQVEDYDGGALHGTYVLEVIHRTAPAADLFACQYADFAGFAACVDWMLTRDVALINHSAGVPALPLDGTNAWARQVERAAQAGVLWVNAAGNFAGGHISDIFTDTNLNTYHEFRGAGVVEALAVPAPGVPSGIVTLSWEGSGTLPASSIDFDLEVLDAGGVVIASSSQPQRGEQGDAALEWVMVPMEQPFGVRVRNADGLGDRVRFDLFVEFASLPGATAQGSVIAPADSSAALTVGALIDGQQVAPYSSRGPSGSHIKPDLTAPGQVQLVSGLMFSGTSAAAPIVAGAAALLWEEMPQLSGPELAAAVRTDYTLDDPDNPGIDNIYGYGRLYVTAPTPPTLPPAETASAETLRLLADRETLVLYVAAAGPLNVGDLQFRVNLADGLRVDALRDWFDVLAFTGGIAEPGACFVLRLDGSSAPLPAICRDVRLINLQRVAPADVFWFDPVQNTGRSVAVYRGDSPVTVCSAGTIDCSIAYPGG